MFEPTPRSRSADRFVRKLPTDDPATAHLSARVATADAIFFDAMVDRIADILSDRGDLDPWDALRAKSVGILANPARAQLMLAEAARASAAPPSDDPEPPWPETDAAESAPGLRRAGQ